MADKNAFYYFRMQNLLILKYVARHSDAYLDIQHNITLAEIEDWPNVGNHWWNLLYGTATRPTLFF